MLQQTIDAEITVQGAGLHSGAASQVRLMPAEPGTGRVFVKNGVEIPALAEFVTDSRRCTTLGREGEQIHTVEHLLSALHGLWIDNVRIEVSGPELPALDGSCLPWAHTVLEAGVREQNETCEFLAVQNCAVQMGGSSLQISRLADELHLQVAVDFEWWPEGKAEVCWNQWETYLEYAPARTFAFMHELEMLKATGLGKGGSLDNVLVITPPDQFSTPLRMQKEWAVHKMMDLLGDLALAGGRLAGRVEAVRPGHSANVTAALELRRTLAKINQTEDT